MNYKKGDKVVCWGYGSISSHYHNGCVATVECVEEEHGCVPKKKPEVIVGVVFKDFPSMGTEFFHPKQLSKLSSKKK